MFGQTLSDNGQVLLEDDLIANILGGLVKARGEKRKIFVRRELPALSLLEWSAPAATADLVAVKLQQARTYHDTIL